MRILFLVRRFYPEIGGVEKHVLEVGKRLAEAGHKVTVVTESYVEAQESREDVFGVWVVRMPYFKEGRSKKFKIWHWIFNNQEVTRKTDIVHCHDVFFWWLPFRFLFPTIKVFTTFHGYESYPVSVKAIIIRKISEILSNGNICIGGFIKKWYLAKPTFVSYGGVDIPKENKKYKKTNSAIFIGRLDDQTSILDYVHAVKKIKKEIPDFKLDVIGDGEYKNKISNYVNILGWKKNPEQYFQNYRFAFVSRYLSILEALAAKRLVFALYDNPIKKDYLIMSPFSKYIIIVSNAHQLKTKVQYYLAHPKEEQKLIERANKWVQKQTWSHVSNIYLRLWEFK